MKPHPAALIHPFAVSAAINLDLKRCAALPEQRQRHALRQEIPRLFQQQRLLPVLIIDEAHQLRNEVLEDLRLLTNFSMDSEPRMCLLLIGLTELRRRLSMGLHQSLNQRLIIRHHFGALSRDETERYLLHRPRLAGAADNIELFEANATEMLHAQVHGMPRQINRLAHYAMSAAAQQQARLVSLEHMTQAVEEWKN